MEQPVIINREKGWLVVTPPKTGSCTLNRMLCLTQFGGTPYFDAWHHNTEVPAWAAGFRVFLSVRDPFARASSLYRWQFRDQYMEGPIAPFSEFARRILLAHEGHFFYWRTVAEWHPAEASPIRLEHLAEDLEALSPSGPYLIPLENPDPRLEPWTQSFGRDPAAWPLVAEWARADCERFGYSNSRQWAVGSGQ